MTRKFWAQRKWAVLGLTGSVLLLSTTIGGIGYALVAGIPAAQPEHIDPVLDAALHASTEPQPQVEMMSEKSGEFKRVHYARLGGTRAHTEIFYRNEARGTVLYRPDNTVSSFKIVAPDGFVLHEASYDATGTKVVNGFEKRFETRKPLWKVATLANGDVHTIRWWKNGSVFADELVSKAAGTIETTYWRGGGSKWMRTIAKVDTPDVPYLEEFFELSDYLEWRIERDSNGAADVSFFRRDGTLYFVRHHRLPMMMGAPTLTAPTAQLASTTVYAADGKRVALQIWWWSELTPSRIEIPNPDGSKAVHYFGFERQSDNVRYFDAKGEVIKDVEKGADGRLFQQIDPRMYRDQVPPPQDQKAQRDEIQKDWS